jgi:DNA modification methylase
MLFDLPDSNGESAFNDPAFVNNKNAPVHRWVPWIAGFSREFVQGAIERHMRGRGTILDPFAGVGTTLVEAVLAGHDTVGFEINPYAALACRTKLRACQLSAAVVRKSVEDFRSFYEGVARGGYISRSEAPPGFKTRADFYSPKVLRKVLAVQDFIARQEEGVLRDIFRIAFASTMVQYSNYSYEPSLTRRAAVGRDGIEDFPVLETIVMKLLEIAQDIEWMRKRVNGKATTASIFNESFFTGWKKLDKGSVDLLITSPPYLNNYHYNRNTRPHLYWLGFAKDPADFKRLEEENFGKFWQTVREHRCIDLDFPCRDEEILECLQELRARTPEKGVYGGNGWANYATSYFNDCYRFAKATGQVLKRSGTALVVIGNSILQGVMIPTDRFLGKIAEMVGLEVVEIHIPRATRVGNSIIQSDVRVTKAKKSDKLYEAVVELRRG